MKIAGLLVLSTFLCTTALAADPCNGADGAWQIGGLALDGDATALMRGVPGCPKPGYVASCSVTAADGFTYFVQFDGKAGRVGIRSRAIRADEVLPFGVTTADTAAKALAKVRAHSGVGASYSATASRSPYSVAMQCGHPGDLYMMEFILDAHRHPAVVSQSRIYVVDIPKSREIH